MKSGKKQGRIFLSPPHMGDLEQKYIAEAFASNWIAPLGPHVESFQREFAATVGVSHALATISGTAALHLALQLVGVGHGDDVFVSTLTFAASVNPIRYLGAAPVLVDSERESWNIDPHLVAQALQERAKTGKLPKAVVVVHLYGQSADMDPILESCRKYQVPVIEDAAEALGATYKGRPVGTLGRAGIFSFNGNKIITTSGGGMLVSEDRRLVTHAFKLATQARDPAPYYEHSQVGYNYRMSNVLAGIGRGQLRVLSERVAARRRNFEFYASAFRDVPGIEFMPEAPWGSHTRWLTTAVITPTEFGIDRDELRQRLDAANIEARPVWKPMHLQPIYRECTALGGSVAEDLFRRGLCLPSGSNMTADDLERVVTVVRDAARQPLLSRAVS
ncbi:MAG TPA: aminotransferase class I/II-fold pyridoxal phosphate-dependent enzyme [Gemmatimonadaceae bacterium]|nr:aminotransferase class I/II-fold pyridoxal phosphate-dependent enzyme [Gemmatimonadaceae bacterium]